MKEYKPLKFPKGLSEGLIFSMANSRQLDIFGDRLSVKRRKFLLLKEPSFLFKIRIRNKAIVLREQGLSEWNHKL